MDGQGYRGVFGVFKKDLGPLCVFVFGIWHNNKVRSKQSKVLFVLSSVFCVLQSKNKAAAAGPLPPRGGRVPLLRLLVGSQFSTSLKNIHSQALRTIWLRFQTPDEVRFLALPAHSAWWLLSSSTWATAGRLQTTATAPRTPSPLPSPRSPGPLPPRSPQGRCHSPSKILVLLDKMPVPRQFCFGTSQSQRLSQLETARAFAITSGGRVRVTSPRHHLVSLAVGFSGAPVRWPDLPCTAVEQQRRAKHRPTRPPSASP